MEIVAFIAFLVLFVLIGVLSTRRHNTAQDIDYLMAGREVSPLLTALSAAATKYSGYMFIAYMGYIYQYGLSAIWLACGFFFGDMVSYLFVHQKLREHSEKTNAMSYADLISRWHSKDSGSGDYKALKITIGIITLLFLTTYAAAQFNAGGKALQVLFGWHQSVGLVIGAGLILSYCLTGGLRASIWTDAAQSIVMLIALVLLFGAAVMNIGGIGAFFDALNQVSSSYMSLGVDRFGSLNATILFAIGWLFNGLGVTGQPQVMVRFMALDKSEHVRKTGLIYFAFSGTFLALVMLVGLATRLFVDNSANFDAELAMPMLATQLLPAFAFGIVIGGVFAAVISTTDSQILSCSAVISSDFSINKGKHTKAYITLIVTIVALAIALFASASVFTLVILAWSALACTIGPLVIVQALGYRPSQPLAFVMMSVGFITAITWRQLGLNTEIYEAMPGMIAPIALFFIVNAVKPQPGGERFRE